MLNKTLLTQAFELMGPDRVAKGLTAQTSDWRYCFLSRAYEEYNLGEAYTTRCGDTYDWVGRRIGLAYELVRTVADGFDFYRSELRALAQEWLEVTNAARTPTCSDSSRRSRTPVPDSGLVAARS